MVDQTQPQTRPVTSDDTTRLAKALGLYTLKERLDPQEIFARLSSLAILTCVEGSEIVREGSVGNDLYIVSRGSAFVTRGGKAVARLAAGDMFGEVAFLSGVSQERSATVRAGEGCEVFRCEAQGFKELFSKYPKLVDCIRGIAQARLKKLES